MIPFRSIVASQMVRVHKIPSELAEYHVSRMERKELLDRFKKYAGVLRSTDCSQKLPRTIRYVGDSGISRAENSAGMELGMNLIECPICLEMVERLVRDHNHETGYIRGGICNPCNGKLGLLERHPESYYLRKKPGGRLWRRWVYDNAERIYAHLQTNTGEQMGRQLESRWVKEAMKLFDNPGLGLPLALALPESAESRTNLGETEGHGS